MTPELWISIFSLLLTAGVGAYVAISKLGGEKRKTESEIIDAAYNRLDKFNNDVQEELDRLEKKISQQEQKLAEQAEEIKRLYAGQRERDEMIAELRASILQLEAENVQLRQKLNETHLELEAWRRGQRRTGP